MTTVSASTLTNTAYNVVTDTTGTLVFQTGSTPTTALSISASQVVTFANAPTSNGGGSVASNTAFGSSALQANTSGSDNTAVGYQAAYTNSTGAGITAIGYQALYNTTVGYGTAVGYLAGNSNTTGEITAVGTNVLRANTTGVANTAIGGYSLTAGVDGALRLNTTGSYNIAVGTGSLASNTSASNNTAVGYQAGYTNSTGGSNAALGYASLYYNTTGSNNASVGYEALFSNTTGSFSTVAGYQAGYSNTTGQNTFIGASAGFSNTTGTGNTFIGGGVSGSYYSSGYYVTTGNYNTILGNYNGNQGSLNITTSSNYIVLSDGQGNPRGIFDPSGDFLVGTTAAISNANGIGILPSSAGAYITIGHATGTSSGNYYQAYYYNGTAIGSISQNGTTAVAYNTSSDPRLKNITGPVTAASAIAFVQALQPKTGTWIADGSSFTGFVTTDYEKVDAPAVVGTANAVDADGKPIYQQMEYGSSAWCANMTAALQSALTTISTMQATLKAAGVAGF